MTETLFEIRTAPSANISYVIAPYLPLFNGSRSGRDSCGIFVNMSRLLRRYLLKGLIVKGLVGKKLSRLVVSSPSSLLSPKIPVSIFSIAALSVIINSWVNFDLTRDTVLNNEILTADRKCAYTSFEYIIVGAGAAGMVVATRLANASSNAKVLLLEAGSEPHVLNNLPMLNFHLMSQPANSWIYKSTPQNNMCGMCTDKRVVTPTGKMLGGSTSINFMFYARGNQHDFNRWAVDVNDSKWDYENVLPYFKKSENYDGAYAHVPLSTRYHGKGGLLNVVTPDYSPGVDDFLAAGTEKGYVIGDYNGETQEVFSRMEVTTQDGWRENTYRAYYKDTGKPNNLCVKKFALVTQIKFEEFNGKLKAVGVMYKRQKQTRWVRATKEVILSAGTMGTAKLLLLSGIGPSDHLKQFGVPVVKDLPVGHNVQDHVFAIVGPFLKGPSLNPKFSFNFNNALNFLLRQGKGPLTAPAGIAGTAFFQSPFAQPPYPDLQAIQFSFSLYPELPMDLSRVMGLDSAKLANWLHPYQRKNVDARFVAIILGRPKSVGRIKLATKDPHNAPTFDPNFLSHPDDLEALLFGFRKVVDLYENSKSLNTTLFLKPLPDCQHEKFKSDNYYRCVIKHLSATNFNTVGSCALGRVVDHQLRVKGIDGLRVIDASVMPRTPNANTQAATVMIGEKGVDLILQDTHEHDTRARFISPRSLECPSQ